MKNLKELNNKILRSRIDGANFTCLIPFNPNDFNKSIIDLKHPENSKEEFNLNTLININKNSILKVFGLTEACVQYTRTGLKIIETNNLGIYCDLSRRKYDLQIHIQFKGLFFIRKNALNDLRLFLIKLVNETRLLFRLTLIDIAKDILLKPYEILPYNDQNKNLVYNFKHRFQNYSEQKDGKIFDTGFELRNSRFKIKVYDKRFENQSHKNIKKREYYNQIYSEFVDSNNNLLPVSRFEITLKQEACRDFIKHIFDFNISEDFLITSILHKFSLTHSLRERPKESIDKNLKRWPIAKNWVDLFTPTSTHLIKAQTPSDFRFSNPRINLETLITKLAEALVFQDEYCLETLNPQILLKLVETKIDVIIENARRKKLLHTETLRIQESAIKAIQSQLNDNQLLLLGDFL